MIKPIVRDAFFLNQRSEEATKADLPVVQDLEDTLRANRERCVGMAANMIGVKKRVIVVSMGPMDVVMYNFWRMLFCYGVSALLAYALTFLTPGTQAYKDLNDTSIGVVWNPVYNNIDSSNTVASPVVVWADNCCSVDVSYDTTYTLNDGSADHSVGTMRIYYLKADNGNYYISNFETL